MLLEQAEAKLERERLDRQSVVDFYKKCISRSDESKKKHDKAVEEYHRYEMQQAQAQIKLLEQKLAAKDSESSSSEEEQDESDYEENKAEEVEDDDDDEPQVVDLDSDE